MWEVPDDILVPTSVLHVNDLPPARPIWTVTVPENGSFGSNLTTPLPDEVRFAVPFVPEEDLDRELFQGYPTSLLTIATVFCLLFMLVGIPGNLITIIALFRCKKVSVGY
ncbi:hypothetical protein GE061_012466 [Apolygus lucorum]|uniref:G-protein coupled receptors family 1 profile domain-containing protein n=1 Tax=Apolygus lucorum TaxID=248454 RepID=A0A8S9XTQ8_APOLU|nr:hypothetical protein GE061_012466 [Apolygus lucorum]